MITRQEVKRFFSYNAETGVIFWKERPARARHIFAGDVAGTDHGDGYVSISFKRRKYLRHRLAWFYVYGTWPKELDHINNIPGDDRIANLRPVTRSQNVMNSKPFKNTKSGHKGVFYLGRAYKTKPWRAYITKNKRRINLGLFATVEEAARVRNLAAQSLHGEFAR